MEKIVENMEIVGKETFGLENHLNYIGQKLSSFYADELLCDVTLIVGDRS